MPKRSNYMSKDESYMKMAQLIAKRSKDPSSQVGAVIVSADDRILSIGYNGFPNGISDDEFPWEREAEKEVDTKYPYVCHAEANAILNFRGDIKALSGATLYVTLFPCNECMKLILQVGITNIIYLEDKYPETTSHRAVYRMANATHTSIQPFKQTPYEKIANKINKIYILQNSPKYRNVSSSENVEQTVRDWYKDIEDIINS